VTEDCPVGCDETECSSEDEESELAELDEGLAAFWEIPDAGGGGYLMSSWRLLVIVSAIGIGLVATCGVAVMSGRSIEREVFMVAGLRDSITGGKVSTCRSIGVGLAMGVELLVVADGLISRCSR
jgi:hypothetical protein